MLIFKTSWTTVLDTCPASETAVNEKKALKRPWRASESAGALVAPQQYSCSALKLEAGVHVAPVLFDTPDSGLWEYLAPMSALDRDAVGLTRPREMAAGSRSCRLLASHTQFVASLRQLAAGLRQQAASNPLYRIIADITSLQLIERLDHQINPRPTDPISMWLLWPRNHWAHLPWGEPSFSPCGNGVGAHPRRHGSLMQLHG